MPTEAQRVNAQLLRRVIASAATTQEGERQLKKGPSWRPDPEPVKDCVFFQYNATRTAGAPRCEFSILSEVGQPYQQFFEPLIKGLTLEVVEIDTPPWVVTVVKEQLQKPQTDMLLVIKAARDPYFTDRLDVYLSEGLSRWNHSDYAQRFTPQEADAMLEALHAKDRSTALDNRIPYQPSTYELVDVATLPVSEDFQTAHPLSDVPERDKEVILVYRSGRRTGVSGNFLHEELTRAPDGWRTAGEVRWRYTGRVRQHEAVYA